PAFLQNRLLGQVKSSRSINRFRILHGRLDSLARTPRMPKGVERPDPHAGRTVDRLQPQSNRRSQNHTIRAHYQSRLRRLSSVAQNTCLLSTDFAIWRLRAEPAGNRQCQRFSLQVRLGPLMRSRSEPAVASRPYVPSVIFNRYRMSRWGALPRWGWASFADSVRRSSSAADLYPAPAVRGDKSPSGRFATYHRAGRQCLPA